MDEGNQGQIIHKCVLPDFSEGSRVPTEVEVCRALCQRGRHLASGVLGSLLPPRFP